MKVNPVGKKLSEVDRAYMAGFLDADGCIMATIEPHPEKRFEHRVRLTVKVSQSNRNILDWFKKTIGFGAVRRNRTVHDWLTRDQKAIESLLAALLPFLKVKKKQAQIALRILHVEVKKKADLLRVARLADELAKLNVRSGNRRKNFVSTIQEFFSRND